MVRVNDWTYIRTSNRYAITTHKGPRSLMTATEPLVKLLVDDANDVISKYNSLVDFCKNIKMTADENETFLFIIGAVD